MGILTGFRVCCSAVRWPLLPSGWNAAILAAGIAMGMAAMGVVSAVAETRTPLSESDAKAAALYHLVHFAEWPPDTFPDKNSPLIIGVYGRDPFGNVLEGLVRGESSEGRPLKLIYCFTPEDAAACHILFVPRAEASSLERVLRAVENHPVLTVGDADNFIARGGMIRLAIRDQHIRIIVDLQAVRRENLTLSAKLLKLAEVVNGKAE